MLFFLNCREGSRCWTRRATSLRKLETTPTRNNERISALDLNHGKTAFATHLTAVQSTRMEISSSRSGVNSGTCTNSFGPITKPSNEETQRSKAQEKRTN